MAKQRTARKKERDARLYSWLAILALGAWAWQSGIVTLWVLPVLAFCYYQLCLVPTLCGVETTRRRPCKNRAYGRLMACRREPSHWVYKRNALLDIAIRRGPRTITAPAPRPAQEGKTQTTQAIPEFVTVEQGQAFITFSTLFLTLISTITGVIQVAQG